MAKIFSPPSQVIYPKFDFTEGIAAYRVKEEKYLTELKELLQKRCKQEHVGETIKFPVADGYAVYMVASMKPLQLVHLPIGDAWQYEYAHRLIKKDVEQKIAQEQALSKLFGPKAQ